jgi:hypothetical protein
LRLAGFASLTVPRQPQATCRRKQVNATLGFTVNLPVRIWSVVKAIVSLASLSFAALLGLMFVHEREAGTLGLASAFLFLAALPWLKLEQPSRALSLAGIVFSFGVLFVASRPFSKAGEYPLSCVGRRSWCDVENLLFLLGGPPLAALPFATLGLGLLAFSLRAVWRPRR